MKEFWDSIKRFIKRFMLGTFVWVGSKMFKSCDMWGNDKDNVDAITFSKLDNWSSKYKYSKRDMGIRTPKRLQTCTKH